YTAHRSAGGTGGRPGPEGVAQVVLSSERAMPYASRWMRRTIVWLFLTSRAYIHSSETASIHRWALLCPVPNRRPCTTWSADVFRETRINKSRSSGVGRGQLWYTVNRRVVRGFPSIRHAAIRAWNAVSKGETSC